VNKLRVGIVGCGTIFPFHYKYAASHPEAMVCGVADTNEKALQKARELFGVPKTYSSLEEMIRKEETEVIHITTPPQTHASLVEKAILMGNHVLVEKPLALNYPDSVRLFELAEKNRVKVCVDHNHLYDPWMEEARRIISGFDREEIVYVESYYGINTQIPEIMGYRGADEISWIFNLPGGVFHDFMTHPLYLLLEFTGEPVRFSTMARSHGALFQNLSDELHLLVEGKNALGKLTVSFNARPFQHFLKIYLKRMSVLVDFNQMTLVVLPHRRGPGAVNKILNNLSTAKQLTFQTFGNSFKFALGKLKRYAGVEGLIHAFYDSIIRFSDSPVPPGKALGVLKVMDGIWKDAGKLHPRFENLAGLRTSEEPAKGKVLVTGAGGFLGRRLTEVLTEKGYLVRVLVRKLTKVDTFEKLGVEVHYGDVREEEKVRNAMAGMDYVIHAAAAQDGDRDTFEKVTIEGTERIMRLAGEMKLKRLVYISSMSVYQVAGLRDGDILSEEAELEKKPDDRGYYTWSKLEAERVVQKMMTGREGAPTAILRPATIYGPGGPVFTPLFGISLFDKVFVTLGKKKNPLPVVFIDNLIDAILASLEKGEAVGGIFNVIDDEVFSKKEYGKKFIKHLFPKSYVVHLPYWFVFGAVLFQEVVFKSMKRAPVLTRYRLESASKGVRFSNQKARERLAWTPKVPVEEALEKTLSWAKKYC
jgi:2-alkyl-3-oxoalkanoate reductase